MFVKCKQILVKDKIYYASAANKTTVSITIHCVFFHFNISRKNITEAANNSEKLNSLLRTFIFLYRSSNPT